MTDSAEEKQDLKNWNFTNLYIYHNKIQHSDYIANYAFLFTNFGRIFSIPIDNLYKLQIIVYDFQSVSSFNCWNKVNIVEVDKASIYV